MIRDIIDQPGFKKELNEEMLQLYLSLTYVAGENTFFRGLKKLLPGRYLSGRMESLRFTDTGNRNFIRMRVRLWKIGLMRFIIL